MTSKLLVSVSAIVLVGLLGVARADDAIDQTAVALAAMQVGVPADAFTNATQDAVTAAVKSVATVKADQDNLSGAQGALAKAQKDVSTNKATYDSLSTQYQTAAQGLVDAKANLDQVIATYKNSTPQQVLTDANRSLNIAKQTAITAANTLQAYSGLPDSDPRKKEAITANHDAQNIVVEKQAAANRAGDIAAQANVSSAALIAAAQAKYDTAHNAVGDASDPNSLNSRKLAAQKSWDSAVTAVNTATASINTIQGTLKADQTARDGKVATALVDVNKDALAYKDKPVQAPAASTPAAAGQGGQKPGTGTTPPPLVVVGGSTPPLAGGSGSPVGGPPALLPITPVISNDGGSIVSEHGAGLIGSDSAGKPAVGLIGSDSAGKPASGIISDNTEGLFAKQSAGLLSEHGAGLTSVTASALVAGLPVTGLISNAPSASNAFKQDSTISAFTNIDTSSPSEKWQKAVGNLSKADQQALSDLKAAIAKTPGMQLTQAQVDLVSKVTKAMDPQAVQSLEQGVAQKIAVATKTATLNQAVTTMVVNNAITDAKSDPQVVSAVLKVATGKTPTATETQHVNDAVAKAVDNLPISTADKKAIHQRTREHVAAVVTPPAKTAVTVQPTTPPISQAVVDQMAAASQAIKDNLNKTLAATTDKAAIVALQQQIANIDQVMVDVRKQAVVTTVNAPVTPVNLEQSSNTRRGRDGERSASTNREREPERSANTRRDFIPEHSPAMRREQEREREANTRRDHEREGNSRREREANVRRDREPEHSNMRRDHEHAREANRHHEGVNPGNRQQGSSATARTTTTYTAASTSKAPPPPKTPPAVSKVPPPPPPLPPRH